MYNSKRNFETSGSVLTFAKDGNSLHCLVRLPEGRQEAEVGQDRRHSSIQGSNQHACYSQIIFFRFIVFPFGSDWFVTWCGWKSWIMNSLDTVRTYLL
jgi:hypothetical protein